jgi:homoserine dehydrogenase
VPYLAFQNNAITAVPVTTINELVTRYYLRMDVARLSHTMPVVLSHFTKAGVQVRQLEVFAHPDDSSLHAVVALTESTQECVLRVLLPELEALPHVMGFVTLIRMEDLD